MNEETTASFIVNYIQGYCLESLTGHDYASLNGGSFENVINCSYSSLPNSEKKLADCQFMADQGYKTATQISLKDLLNYDLHIFKCGMKGAASVFWGSDVTLNKGHLL